MLSGVCEEAVWKVWGGCLLCGEAVWRVGEAVGRPL